MRGESVHGRNVGAQKLGGPPEQLLVGRGQKIVFFVNDENCFSSVAWKIHSHVLLANTRSVIDSLFASPQHSSLSISMT